MLRRSSSPAGARVSALLKSGQARLCGPVESELVIGTRDKEELTDALSAVPYVPAERPDFIRSGELQRALATKGVALKPTDALIAAMALRRDMALLTLDFDFKRIPGLKLELV